MAPKHFGFLRILQQMRVSKRKNTMKHPAKVWFPWWWLDWITLMSAFYYVTEAPWKEKGLRRTEREKWRLPDWCSKIGADYESYVEKDDTEWWYWWLCRWTCMALKDTLCFGNWFDILFYIFTMFACLRTYDVIPESCEWHNAIYPFITMPTCLFTAYLSTLCAHLQYKVWQCDAKPVASAIKDLHWASMSARCVLL